MKLIITALILALFISPTASARKRKPAASRSRVVKTTRKPAAAVKEAPGRLIGTPVVITTASGGQITGALAGLDASTVRIRSNGFESAIGLETVGSISF